GRSHAADGSRSGAGAPLSRIGPAIQGAPKRRGGRLRQVAMRCVDWLVALAFVGCAAGGDKQANQNPSATAATQVASTAAADSAGVAALYDQLKTIGQRGDPDEYAGMFAETGTVLAPNAPAPAGRAELREWARRFFEH